MNDVLRLINERNLQPMEMALTPAYLSELLKLVDAGTINTTTAKALLQDILESGKPPAQIVEEKGLAQVTDDSAIRAICEQVINDHPDEVVSYREGKESLIGWFVGQVMRSSRGKADAKAAREILSELLAK